MNREDVLSIILIFLASTGFLIAFHTKIPVFFHESGHALNCIMQNGTVVQFVVNETDTFVQCKGSGTFDRDSFLISGFVMDNVVSIGLVMVPPVSVIGGLWTFSRACQMWFGGYSHDFLQLSYSHIMMNTGFELTYMTISILVLSASVIITYMFWDYVLRKWK